MICPRCGTRLRGGPKFCGECGSPLPWRCAACGRENPPGTRFCGECGAAAGAAPGAPRPARPAVPAAERRQVTVMLADLVNSTEIGARLDPEDTHEVIRAWRDCVTGLIVRHGGFVSHYMGDAALALFGYPQAHEADPERAVRAGLAIVQAVSRLDTPAGPAGTLAMRVGLATGLVVTGDLIGAGSALEWSVVGEIPNLAARLQALAEPGTVVIDTATRQLNGALFEYRAHAETAVKGLAAPVRAWTVLRESVVESRFEALRAPLQMSLVNRVAEMDALLQHWARAKSGAGQAVLLVGDPGAGKSHLVAAFEERIGDAARKRLRLLCSPHHQDTPLHPLIRHLERAAGFHRDDPPLARREKLRRLHAPTASVPAEGETDAPALADEVGEAMLAELLSLPPHPDQAPREIEPLRQKELTFAAVLRHVTALAAGGPLAAVVEDAHW
ncbi:MAG: AAA family ATPase, partial [Acetobacteraceae bacterium]|nr:AAA family ATPase [Acetobacteraceae bacterium]